VSRDPLGWFEELYAAAPDARVIPWAAEQPHPLLVDWLDAHPVRGRALVVACGLGDDAEELARRGLDVTAFDLSPSAIAWAKRRFPETRVEYVVANALEPPAEWEGAFDLVVEVYTLQAVPAELRPGIAATIGHALAPGGTVVAIARGRDEDERFDGPPWPLSPSELRGYFPFDPAAELDEFAEPDGARRLRLTAQKT
jgi:SAM-dependent methyltransferase